MNTLIVSCGIEFAQRGMPRVIFEPSETLKILHSKNRLIHYDLPTKRTIGKEKSKSTESISSR